MREPFLRRLPNGLPYHQFHFQVVRLWEVPVEEFLEGGLGTLPLAPLCRVSKRELPSVIRRMEERIGQESIDAERTWIATYVLMGLRYDSAFIEQLLRGVQTMEESVTYQAIIRKGEARGRVEGRVEGELNLLLLLGRNRFGEPTKRTLSKLQSITSTERLERLAIRMLTAESWKELLADTYPD